MANYVVSDTSLGSVADAIRTKGGTSAPLTYPQGFIDAIGDIQTGGGDEPIPDDGKTRIFIHIADGTPDNRLTFYLRFTASVASNTTVDWGDGTVETLGSTTATNYEHKYSHGGDYVIAMTVNSGTISFEGDSSNGIYGSTSNNNYHNRYRIYRIIFGNDVVNVGNYLFSECYGLLSVTFSDSITSIGDSTFSYCRALTHIVVFDSVTNIGSNTFYECRGMSEYHFLSTTPPTLSNSGVFGGSASDCVIYVPQGSLNAYKTATNWTTYKSKIREEPT